ncbi:F-actin-capping protein subunit alpha [Diplonema papillatum]|nr:F-actin-capping protein subunit alpha [Diplonema papillatum]|eukprot:gene18151-27960_t
MASDDEKRDIAKQFILASPCHELKHVIKDVRVLVQDDALIDDLLPETVRQYNVENFVPIESPYGNIVVLCEAGAGEEDHTFLDPKAQKYFKVTDHVKLKTEEASGSAAEDPKESFRSLLDTKLGEYVSAHYKSGAHSVFKSGDDAYVILINSEKSNPGSSWSGRWKTYVTVTLTSATSASLSGVANNAVHYYEEGNVQMDSSKEVSRDVKGDSEEALVRKIVTFCEDSEFDFHSKIDEVCASLSAKSLKTLRRRLPVSKQHFNFSSGAHKLAMELTQGTKD